MDSCLCQAGEMTVLISSHELGEIDGVGDACRFSGRRQTAVRGIDGRPDWTVSRGRITTESEAKNNRADCRHIGWMVRTTGNVLSFVDAHFSDEVLDERLHSLVRGVKRIDAEPMALRSIFTTLAPRVAGWRQPMIWQHLQKRRETHLAIGAAGGRACTGSLR